MEECQNRFTHLIIHFDPLSWIGNRYLIDLLLCQAFQFQFRQHIINNMGITMSTIGHLNKIKYHRIEPIQKIIEIIEIVDLKIPIDVSCEYHETSKHDPHILRSPTQQSCPCAVHLKAYQIAHAADRTNIPCQTSHTGSRRLIWQIPILVPSPKWFL